LRSHRCRGAAAKGLETRLEPLEKRIALDASVDAAFQRPLLTQNQSIYLYPGEDASQGPLPVVFGKSDIVGNDADSFIVTGVVNGVVEKWDAATKTWQDVSTKPTSSNPLHLLRLLRNRHVRPTDRVRWVPDSGTRTAAPSQAFTSLAWNTGAETEPDCPETTVAYVSSSVQALGSANGDAPVSVASQTTEITCDCGCAPKPDLENLNAEELTPGTFIVTWDKAPDANGNIELIRTQKLKTATKRFETSDLVWHDGLQRFFAVSDDGGKLATFTYDGTGIAGDGVVQQYWDLTSQLEDKLGDKWTDNAQSFEGLTFKKTDSPTDTVIYIGTEFESDTSNRIIEFDFTGSFDPETGTWLGASGSITNVFDLKDVMPGAPGDNNKKAGLEALTFVPDTTGGVFYVGQQYDGEILKLKLNSETGTVEDVGRVIFDDLPRSDGFVDLSAMQYVELKGEPFLLTLFGEGFNSGDDNNRQNELPVRISIAKLEDLAPTDKGLINTQATVGLNWDQTSDLVKSDWPSLFGLNEEGQLSQDFGVMGPEGIAYFEYNGEKRIAIASDPGDHQLLDGERIGRVKIFKGFDLEAPQVSYTVTETDETGAKPTFPQTYFNHMSVPALAGHTYTVEVYSTGRWADGTTGEYQPASSVSFTTEAGPSPILGSSPATGLYTENYVTSFGDLDGWTVEDRDINGQHYARENVVPDSGGLRLAVTANDNGTPVSGRVIKNDGWKYGLFVFETSQIPKAKVSDYPWPTMDISLKHLWPALWTLGPSDENPDLEFGNMWPLRGEIDVMETVRAIDSRPDYTSRIMVASDAFFNAPNYQRQSLPGDGDEEIKSLGISPSQEGSLFRSGWDRPHTFAVDWYPVVNAKTGQEIDWRFDFYQDVGVNDDGELVQKRFWSRGDLVDTQFLVARPGKTYSLRQLIEDHNAKVDEYQDGLNPDNGDKVTFENIVGNWGAHRPVLNVAVGNHENGTGQWEWNTPWQSEISGIETKAEGVSDDGKTLSLPTGSLTGIAKSVTIAPEQDQRLWELFVGDVVGLDQWDLVTGDGIPEGTKIFGFSNSHPDTKIKLISPEYADEISAGVDTELVFKKDIRRGDLVVGEGIAPFTRVSWIDGDSITLDKAANISPGTDIKFKRFAAHLPTDGSADMVVRSFAHYTRPAVYTRPAGAVDPLPLTVVIRHGSDGPGIDRTSQIEDNSVETIESALSVEWLNAEPGSSDVNGFPLGLNSSSNLSDTGWDQAKSYSTVLPNLIESLGGSPIDRVMADSKWRSYQYGQTDGTSNPIDTVLPLLETLTKERTDPPKLKLDIVVKEEKDGSVNPWMTDAVLNRLTPGDQEGTVVITSTVQNLWDVEKESLKYDSVLGRLNEKYGLTEEYLEGSNWYNATEDHWDNELNRWYAKGDVTFDDVSRPQKGTTIYVYGDLDKSRSGNEVWVYYHDVSNQSAIKEYRHW